MYAARLAFSVCSAPPAATLTVGSLPGHCLGVFSFDPRCSLTVRAQQETVSLQLDLSKADGHPSPWSEEGRTVCNSSSGWLDSEARGFLLLEPGMVILCAWGLLRITVLSYGAPLSCVSGAEICPRSSAVPSPALFFPPVKQSTWRTKFIKDVS